MPDPMDLDKYGIGQSAYKDYRGANVYDTEAGTLVLPTCDGGGPVTIQVHDPYRVRRVSYSGTSLGRPQVMPRPAVGDSVLSHTHSQGLPVPVQGGYGWVYTALGAFTVVESGVAPDWSSLEYECPRYPARMEPMATEMESAGFPYEPGGTLSTPRQTVQLTSPAYQWPQALTITSDFFSDLL